MNSRDTAALASWDRYLTDPPEEDDRGDCRRPGRYGCGVCDGCEAWADAAYDDIGE